MKDTDLLDVKTFIRMCNEDEYKAMCKVLEERRMELEFNRITNIKLKKARNSFRNKLKIDQAEAIYGESIVKQLEEEGFIYKKGEVYILT